jgi:hypothetical protein
MKIFGVIDRAMTPLFDFSGPLHAQPQDEGASLGSPARRVADPSQRPQTPASGEPMRRGALYSAGRG